MEGLYYRRFRGEGKTCTIVGLGCREGLYYRGLGM